MLKIYCPKCKWKPKVNSRWICDPGCHHVWNTFDTFGKCPGCAYVWRETECLSCHIMSPHHEWYHDDGDTKRNIEKMLEHEDAGKL